MGKSPPSQRQLDAMKLQQSFSLKTQALRYVGYTVIVAISVLPIMWLLRIVEAVAGKTTQINVSLSVTIGVSLAITLPAWLITFAKMSKNKKQRDELVRSRERQEELERDLDICRKSNKSFSGSPSTPTAKP